MATETLAPRQRDCLRAIERHIEEHGYPPSTREVLAAMGLRPGSITSVRQHFQRLEAKGYIRRTPHTARCIVVLRGSEEG